MKLEMLYTTPGTDINVVVEAVGKKTALIHFKKTNL